MRLLRKRIGSPTVTVPVEVTAILDDGIVAEDGCLLLAHFAQGDHSPRSAFSEEVDCEAFLNHFHVNAATVEAATQLGLASLDALVSRLEGDVPARPCTAILGVDVGSENVGPSASVRFHVRRQGQQWLSADLDRYEEPVLAVDIDPVA